MEIREMIEKNKNIVMIGAIVVIIAAIAFIVTQYPEIFDILF